MVATPGGTRRSHPWQTDKQAKHSTSCANDDDDNDDDSSLGNGAIARRFQNSNNRTVEPDRDAPRRHHDQSAHADQEHGEREVDYKTNPTQLFQRISHRLWDMAQSRLDSHPSEARVWIVARYESEVGGGFNADDDDDDVNGGDPIQGYQASLGGIKWRNLPLHLALLHSPHPAPPPARPLPTLSSRSTGVRPSPSTSTRASG